VAPAWHHSKHSRDGVDMARKKVFVSFDYDNDADIKMLLVNQSKLPDTPFDIWDS
jgi:hypothetical protein